MPDGVQPGDRVRIISGAFVSMVGQVISDAEALRLTSAIKPHSGPLPPNGPGWIRVAVNIFGQPVPINLSPHEFVPEPPA